MSFYLEKTGNNIWQGRFSLFPTDVAVHGISTRLGGQSAAPYASLDLALHVGDAPESVWQNRQRFCAALGLDARRICTPEQVHGNRVLRVGRKDAGRGSRVYSDSIAATDALITDEPGLPLLLCFADCTPILLLDPVHRAVGIAHGGWKGTVQKIAAGTVQAMQAAFGTRPAEVLVGIGPAIGPCCYEVGDEVAAQFAAAFPGATELLPVVEGHTHLDLWQANQYQLEQVGVKPEHIDRADTCTACNSELFFSYRADGGRTGRIGAVIALKEDGFPQGFHR